MGFERVYSDVKGDVVWHFVIEMTLTSAVVRPQILFFSQHSTGQLPLVPSKSEGVSYCVDLALVKAWERSTTRTIPLGHVFDTAPWWFSLGTNLHLGSARYDHSAGKE